MASHKQTKTFDAMRIMTLSLVDDSLRWKICFHCNVEFFLETADFSDAWSLHVGLMMNGFFGQKRKAKYLGMYFP